MMAREQVAFMPVECIADNHFSCFGALTGWSSALE